MAFTLHSPALAQAQSPISPSSDAKTVQADDKRKRQALVRALADLETGTRAKGNLYLPPNALMTDEMDEYYRRMTGAIEACGSSFFPKEGQASIYGKGAMAISVNRLGNVVKTEVVASSGQPSLDRHMADVVKLAAPFGRLPARLLLAGDGPFQLVVAPVIFDFSKGDPGPVADGKAACRAN